jgi:hypothetical protein
MAKWPHTSRLKMVNLIIIARWRNLGDWLPFYKSAIRVPVCQACHMRLNLFVIWLRTDKAVER